jgi:hypothetical protein
LGFVKKPAIYNKVVYIATTNKEVIHCSDLKEFSKFSGNYDHCYNLWKNANVQIIWSTKGICITRDGVTTFQKEGNYFDVIVWKNELWATNDAGVIELYGISGF